MLTLPTHRWKASVWHGAVVIALATWGTELFLGALGPHLQLVLGGLTFLAVAAAAYVTDREANRRHAEMRRFFEIMCREDLDQIADEPEQDWFIRDRDWSDLLHRLRDSVISLSRGARAAEHGRAGAEVRARRATAERDQLRDLLAACPDPILVVDVYNTITFANAAAEKLFGLQLAGDNYGPVQEKISHEAFKVVLTDTRKRSTANFRTATFSLTDAAGRECDYRATCRLLGSPNASEGRAAMQSIVIAFADVSAQRALQKRNAEFVSSVSHEMKTPLAGINAYVELLIDGDAEDEATRAEFLGVIKSQSERLQRLVENLLNLARIEAGVVKVNKRAQSLNEVLQETFNVLAPTADLKQISLKCELSSMYLGVYADHDTLLQAAINLGSNAIKYTPAGGTVTLRSRMADHEASFEWEDTGVGLSEEDRGRVFEKFYRVKKDANMAPGTGLGLALVKHIVEDVHSGRIEVASELGRGSTFRIVLPTNDQITV